MSLPPASPNQTKSGVGWYAVSLAPPRHLHHLRCPAAMTAGWIVDESWLSTSPLNDLVPPNIWPWNMDTCILSLLPSAPSSDFHVTWRKALAEVPCASVSSSLGLATPTCSLGHVHSHFGILLFTVHFAWTSLHGELLLFPSVLTSNIYSSMGSFLNFLHRRGATYHFPQSNRSVIALSLHLFLFFFMRGQS